MPEEQEWWDDDPGKKMPLEQQFWEIESSLDPEERTSILATLRETNPDVYLKITKPEDVHLEQPYASLYQEPKRFGACGVRGKDIVTTRVISEVTCERCKLTPDYQYFQNEKGGRYDCS